MLGVLATGVGHARPDPGRFVLVGHSAGGNLAAQIAAVASDPHADLPIPQAVVAVMPGEIVPTPQLNLASIAASTLLVVMVGEEDVLVGDLRGRQIFAQATAIPSSRKRFVLFRSDRHGHPPLIADHTAPSGVHARLDNGEGVFRSFQISLGDVNALDRAGFWRMADLTMEASFTGKTLDEAVRDEEMFRHLGFWSDGRKVIQPIVGVDLRYPSRDTCQRLATFPVGALSEAESAGRRGRQALIGLTFERNPPGPRQSSLTHQKNLRRVPGLNPAGMAADTLNGTSGRGSRREELGNRWRPHGNSRQNRRSRNRLKDRRRPVPPEGRLSPGKARRRQSPSFGSR